jgi:hypothetical protein
MKTIIILTAILGLQFNLLFAGNNAEGYSTGNSMTSANLAPSLPSEADFNDIPPADLTFFMSLMPVVPSAASFEDSDAGVIDTKYILQKLVPSTPREAGFEDTDSTLYLEKILAPVLPAVADFED